MKFFREKKYKSLSTTFNQYYRMKTTLSLIVCCCLSLSCFAQIPFETYDSWEKVLEHAKNEKKLIFVQVEATECDECNDVAKKGQNDVELKEKYAQNFVCTKINPTDSWFKAFSDRYDLPTFVASLYFDADENLLLKHVGSTTASSVYNNLANKAIANTEKAKSLQSLEMAYKNGDKSLDFLKKYILALEEMGKDATDITEQYVGKMVIDSLKSPHTIQFLSERGLPYNSPIYALMRANNVNRLNDSIWYSLTLEKRRAITSKIVRSSWALAVKTKNHQLARQTANNIRNNHKKDNRLADLHSTEPLLYFYKSINDTLSYIREAERFCDRHLMSISNDSFKILDTKAQESAMNRQPKGSFQFVSSQYAMLLNNIAWQYHFYTSDSIRLNKALNLSKRSIDLTDCTPIVNKQQNGAFMDTYAHLLYKLKQYDEALTWQAKAIEAYKESGRSTVKFEIELEKMQKRE